MHQTRLSVCALLFTAALSLPARPCLQAGSATWNLNPGSNDWNTAANWTPATVPNGLTDVATFDLSNTTDISVSASTTVDRIVFNPGASKFTVTAQPDVTLTMTGSGIANSSGIPQEFVVQGGAIQFHNSASAADCSFVNQGGTAPGYIQFYDSSTAAYASFVNDAASEGGGGNGRTEFFDSATAGSGTFTNLGGTSPLAAGGNMSFFGASSAGNATLTTEGGSPDGGIASGGAIFFYDDSTADNCTIMSDGGTGTNAFGGGVLFQGSSSADNATLIANGGVNGGKGASIGLKTDGGTARIEVFGNGLLDPSAAGDASEVTIGSLEGDGQVLLGSRLLSIGANNLSTTFSGLIQDSGSIAKVGAGTLTLSEANSYAGTTRVNAGALRVVNSSGSATGGRAVKVNAGTLGGTGIIASATTVGTGGGAGAFLAPALGTNKQVSLTLQNHLTLQADATYTYTFRARKNQARTDLVLANGVTINGATIALQGQTERRLKLGKVLTVLSNTSANPISGTFSNLPDGGVVNVNGNNFQASYSGGDGNDLTLTVVP